jgi:hypothetical protein
MKRGVWMTKANILVVVRKVDIGVYFYEYDKDEYIMLEKSPTEYNLEYIGEL